MTDDNVMKYVREAEENLKLNATLLAKQTDLAREAENKTAPLLEVCKWLLFHAENGRRWRTAMRMGLDFSEDEFENRLRNAITAAEGR